MLYSAATLPPPLLFFVSKRRKIKIVGHSIAKYIIYNAFTIK